MSTTEIYGPPRNQSTNETATATPALLEKWNYARMVVADFTLPPATTSKTQAQWMHELAALSMDPTSLDRESEGNIWGFGADA